MARPLPIRTALPFLLAAFFAALAAAAERSDPLRFSGEARADAAYSFGGAGDVFASGSTVRLDAVGGYRDSAKVEASAVASLVHADGTTVPAGEIRKLFVSVYTDFADLSAGRMIVNYGRGTVFSPVDLFSAVDLSDLALGRIGTDAARLLVPLGDFSGLDLVSTLAERPEDATAGGRLYGNLFDWDFAVSAFRDGGAFFGFDCKGDAVVGVSGEAVVRIEPDGVRYRFMAGLDYSIGGEWLFDAEYLENIEVGEVDRTEAFSGGRCAFVSVSWIPDELTAVGARGVAVFADGAPRWSGTVSASRSIARGATATAYASYDSETEAASVGTRLAVVF